MLSLIGFLSRLQLVLLLKFAFLEVYKINIRTLSFVDAIKTLCLRLANKS